MDNKKMAAVLLGIFLAAGTLEGCGSGQAAGENTAETSSESSGRGGMMAGTGSTEGVDQNLELTESEVDTEFADRDKEGIYDAEEVVMITLDGDSIRAESGSAEITESTLTITGRAFTILRERSAADRSWWMPGTVTRYRSSLTMRRSTVRQALPSM